MYTISDTGFNHKTTVAILTPETAARRSPDAELSYGIIGKKFPDAGLDKFELNLPD